MLESSLDRTLQINPLHHTDPCVASPCRNRPDTGLPCLLLHKSKKNRICANREHIPAKRVRGPGGKIKTHSQDEIKDAIKNGLLEEYRPGPKRYSHKHKVKCGFPECNKTISKGKLCKNCHSVLVSRRRSWKRDHGDEPIPNGWLMRPK